MEPTPGEARRWSTDTGQVALEEPTSGVLVFRMSGKMSASFVAQFERAVVPYIAGNEQVDLFFDTNKMTTYEPEFRERMTAWHEAFKPHTRSASVLVGSKLVAMAIAVANLVTGGILKTYSNHAEFEALILKAVARKTSA